MRVGTPPIIAFAALDAALDIWDEVSIEDVRTRSMELSELFIAEVKRRCPELELASPRAAEERGSQVSFRYEHAYSAMQALIERGGHRRLPRPGRHAIRDCAPLSGCLRTWSARRKSWRGSWRNGCGIGPRYRERRAVT